MPRARDLLAQGHTSVRSYCIRVTIVSIANGMVHVASQMRPYLTLTLTLRDGCSSHVGNRKLQLKVRDLPTSPS